jgi:hemerythrin-like domain-containing protein
MRPNQWAWREVFRSHAPTGAKPMLRDKSLIPLSHQHQQALALCVRIDRAQPIPAAELHAWQAEIEQHFEREIKIHFSAEEQVLFPAARQFPELVPLVQDLTADHASLQESFSKAKAQRMSAEDLPAFAQQLSTHIRKEERQLFERLQQLMTPKELVDLGVQLEVGLKDAVQSCILTNEATRLKPKR